MSDDESLFFKDCLTVDQIEQAKALVLSLAKQNLSKLETEFNEL